MEDIVHIRLLFVAGLLVMAGVMALLASAIAWLGNRRRARAERTRPSIGARQPAKHIPVGGTR